MMFCGSQDRLEYFVGICVPDSCEDSEVQTLVINGKKSQ